MDIKCKVLTILFFAAINFGCSEEINPLLNMNVDNAVKVFDLRNERQLLQCKKVDMLSDAEKGKIPDVFLGEMVMECVSFYKGLIKKIELVGIKEVNQKHFNQDFFSYKSTHLDPKIKRLREAKQKAQRRKQERARQIISVESEIRSLEKDLSFQKNQQLHYETELANLKKLTKGGNNPQLHDRLPHFQEMMEKWENATKKSEIDIAAKKVELSSLKKG